MFMYLRDTIQMLELSVHSLDLLAEGHILLRLLSVSYTPFHMHAFPSAFLELDLN